MIDIAFVIMVVVVIALAALFFKLMEGISHAILMLNILIFILLVIAGVIALNDLKTFSDALLEKEKTVLINNNGNLEGAFLWQGNRTEKIADSTDYARVFRRSEYSTILQKGQIIFVMDKEILEREGINIEQPDFSKSFGTMKLLAEHKKGTVKVYPEPFFFKLSKLIPLSILESPEQQGGK